MTVVLQYYFGVKLDRCCIGSITSCCLGKKPALREGHRPDIRERLKSSLGFAVRPLGTGLLCIELNNQSIT